MRILIVTPAPAGSTKGNRITAERWAEFLRQLGYDVLVADRMTDHCADGSFDCLITLHATRSQSVIPAFRERYPDKPVILCMTGTDLHLDLAGLRSAKAQQQAANSVALTDRIVLLEPEGARSLPTDSRHKVVVIRQSASPIVLPPVDSDAFTISVIGHLRDEKDPFLAARAARMLPLESTIVIEHYGAALTHPMEQLATQETECNHRYRWYGAVPHQEAMQSLAKSQLMALTSQVEGAPGVISEAIVNDVPILATKIPATIGLLGSDYAGLFPVGDAKSLMQQMLRAERDPSFLASLQATIRTLQPKFTADAELQALRELLSSVLT